MATSVPSGERRSSWLQLAWVMGGGGTDEKKEERPTSGTKRTYSFMYDVMFMIWTIGGTTITLCVFVRTVLALVDRRPQPSYHRYSSLRLTLFSSEVDTRAIILPRSSVSSFLFGHRAVVLSDPRDRALRWTYLPQYMSVFLQTTTIRKLRETRICY